MMEGRNPAEQMHPDDLPVVQATFADAMQRSAASGRPEPMWLRRRVLLPDGSYTWVHTSGCMQGNQWYLTCKSMQLQVDTEQALRSLLLSTSHELRTPAQSGLAASQLLAQRASVEADEEALYLVQAIGASCRLLLGALEAWRVAACPMRTVHPLSHPLTRTRLYARKAWYPTCCRCATLRRASWRCTRPRSTRAMRWMTS